MSAPFTVSDINLSLSTSAVSDSTSFAPCTLPPNETDILRLEPPIIAPPVSVTSPRSVTNLTPPIFARAVDIESTMRVFLKAKRTAISIRGS